VPVADLLHEESRVKMESFYAPAKTGTGIVLEGDVAAQVDKLLQILKEKTAVVR
jgi:electron transfer flavoprotein beta subunit